MEPIFVGLVGDHDPEVTAHRAIPKALGLAALSLGRAVDAVWIPTEEVERDPHASLGHLHALWCVPASPYRSMEGALLAIRHARERGLPFLGTCGGFQHAVVEFARGVCGIADADHAETSQGGGSLVVAPLACALVEQSGRVRLVEGSRVREAYGASQVLEEYHCSYGLNPEFVTVLEEHGMRFTGFDAAGEVRVLELPEHPFFVATLFQPERSALRNATPPLVRAFVRAASGPEPAASPADAPEAIAAAFGPI
ncbi:MAG TPA: CTP synthase [Longimicrobium sp.]|jgi:CTP synthase (UTP-ammonia lyase)